MASPPNSNKITVLVLEDNRLDADLATARLTRAGFVLDAYLATTREEYLSQLHARSYDLVLADYDVPGFDGLTALQLARESYPHLPFLFVSGVLGEEVAIDTLQRGATDYVLKQRLERLVPAVRRALTESEEHQNRLRAETKARESEERFRELTNALPQLVWTLDSEGNLTYTNPAWCATMAPEITSWDDPEVMHPEDRASCHDAWLQAHREGRIFSHQCRLHTRLQEGYRWYLVRVVPFGSSGDGSCWLGTATDLHEEKQKEEALRTAEKLAVTGRMAATIAHEINNPLESLTNLVYLLQQERGLSANAQQYMQMAESELQRVSAIAKQTLSFYRETGEQTRIQARELIEEVLRLFDPRLRSKSIHVAVEGEPVVTFHATRGEARQVLINLVGNAIDAVSGGGSIALTTRSLEGGDTPMAEIRVEDDGPGFPQDQAKKIFEPFFSTKGPHGTGLGLWVSKGIAEKYGGHLEIVCRRDEQGKNRTVARVCFPRAASEEADEEQRQPVPA